MLTLVNISLEKKTDLMQPTNRKLMKNSKPLGYQVKSLTRILSGENLPLKSLEKFEVNKIVRKSQARPIFS